MFVRELLLIGQAAKMLNITSATVKDLCLLGELEYTSLLNGKIYVYKDSVDEFKRDLEEQIKTREERE